MKTAAYKADVSNQQEIENTVQQIAQDFGKLDIMVVNSGIASHHPAEEYTTEQWSRITKVNFDGAFYTAQAAGKIFKTQGSGNVIFTASVSATLVNLPQKQAAVSWSYYRGNKYIACADFSQYNASKAGVVQLAKCLAVEWVDFCRVNCISPGFIVTDILDVHPKEWRETWHEMVPARRFADAYELKGVRLSLFIASKIDSVCPLLTFHRRMYSARPTHQVT